MSFDTFALARTFSQGIAAVKRRLIKSRPRDEFCRGGRITVRNRVENEEGEGRREASQSRNRDMP
jgi:hypothetical protein